MPKRKNKHWNLKKIALAWALALWIGYKYAEDKVAQHSLELRDNFISTMNSLQFNQVHNPLNLLNQRLDIQRILIPPRKDGSKSVTSPSEMIKQVSLQPNSEVEALTVAKYLNLFDLLRESNELDLFKHLSTQEFNQIRSRIANLYWTTLAWQQIYFDFQAAWIPLTTYSPIERTGLCSHCHFNDNNYTIIYSELRYRIHDLIDLFKMELFLAISTAILSLLWVIIYKNRKELRHTKDLIVNQDYDQVTWLPSKNHLILLLNSHIADERRNKKQRALYYLDICSFTDLNRKHWAEAWNFVLKEIARKLIESFRFWWKDLIAKTWIDDFVVSVPIESMEMAWALLSKITAIFDKPFKLPWWEIWNTSVSVWVSISPNDWNNSVQLIWNALSALNEAKKSKWQKIMYFNTETNKATERRILLSDGLKEAINKGEFSLNFQPQINLQTWLMSWAEVLLRWNHTFSSWETKRIPPDEFIGLAEENWAITEIWKWVIEEACKQLATWRDMSLPIFPKWGIVEKHGKHSDIFKLAINVSAIQLSDPWFIQIVRNAIKSNWLKPWQITIEITESIINDNSQRNKDQIHATLNELNEYWVCISIDDVLTWKSTYERIYLLPCDEVKIDKTCTDWLDEAGWIRTAIIKSIISLSREMAISCVAEWVETKEQLEILKQIQCSTVQWYYFYKPLSASEFAWAILENFAARQIWWIDAVRATYVPNLSNINNHSQSF